MHSSHALGGTTRHRIYRVILRDLRAPNGEEARGGEPGGSPREEKIRDCGAIFGLPISPIPPYLICIIHAFRLPRVALRKEGRPLAI